MKHHNFLLSIVDTDSVAFSKYDQTPFTEKEQNKLLDEINSLMKPGILWAHDGIFEFVGVIAAKNYILFDGKKTKIKGSALKATKKEPRLKKFINDIIKCIVEERIEEIQNLYFECAKEILAINKESDISLWSFKATATKLVIEPTTSFNKKINDALYNHNIPIIEGDKYYLFFKNVSEIKAVEYIKKNGKPGKKKVKIQNLELTTHYDGDIDKMVLLKKLFVTIKIFNRVLDLTKYPNFTLKKNLKALDSIKSF